MEPANTADAASLGKVDVMFAQQREDPLVETYVARVLANNMRMGRDTTISSVVADHLPRIRVLLIASAGCTALSLAALECVDRVDIVDINPAQLRLVALKAWLIHSGMSAEDQIGFYGLCEASQYTPQWRLQQWDNLKDYISQHASEEGILADGQQVISYWDNHKSHIGFGVARVGVYEAIFRDMTADARSKDIPDAIKQTDQMLASKHRKAWDQVFASTFDRTKLAAAFGEAAVNFSMSEEFSIHFSRQFRKAASSSFSNGVAPSSNYFWRSLWTDGYESNRCDFPYAFAAQLADKLCDDNSKHITAIAIGQYLESESGLKITPTQARNVLTRILSASAEWVELEEKATCTPDEFVAGLSALFEDDKNSIHSDLLVDEGLWSLLAPAMGLPPYLQQNVQRRLRALHGLSKIHAHEGALDTQLVEKLAHLNGPFDLVQTSNITDWNPPQKCIELVKGIKKHLRPGGALITRRLNGDYSLNSVIGSILITNAALNHRLHRAERAFFYSELVVGFSDGPVLPQSSGSLASSYTLATPTPLWQSAADLASIENFDDAISAIERVYDFTAHPYFVWLGSESASKSAFLRSQSLFRYAVEQWSQSVAAVCARIPILEDRIHVFENLKEEHGHGELLKSHKFTFLQFLEAIGGPDAREQSLRKACPIHIAAFNQSLRDFCLVHDATAGAGALGIIEALYVSISEMITRKIFSAGWVQKGQQHHYDVHAELDVEHARELLRVARPGWVHKPLRRDIAAGIVLAAHLFWGLYGNMYIDVSFESETTTLTLNASTSFASAIPSPISSHDPTRVSSSPINITQPSIPSSSSSRSPSTPPVASSSASPNASPVSPSQLHGISRDDGDNAWPILSPTSPRGKNTSNSNANNNNSDSQLRLGLSLLASDPTGKKLEEFKQLGGRHFMPNLAIHTWYNVLFRDIVVVDGWKIQQHKVTSYWRLLDANSVRHCWGTEPAFRVTFAALLKCDVEPITNPKDNRLKITRLHPDTPSQTLKEVGDIVKTLEKGVVYPLGNDFFEIDHGDNYFAFFQRLGQLYYLAVFDEMPKSGRGLGNSGRGELAAVGACIMRQIPKNKQKEDKRVPLWYLCDLKVSQPYKRQHIPIWMGTSEAPSLYRLCSRGYAVAMDPSGGEAPTVKLSRFFKFVPIQVACKLAIFSLDMQSMARALPLLIAHRGENISYLSLANIKDIVLQSTKQPMNLLHVQFGPCADHDSPNSRKQMVDGPVHMFCSPMNDPLTKELTKLGLVYSSTATVMHHRMSDWDWSFILTSDI